MAGFLALLPTVMKVLGAVKTVQGFGALGGDVKGQGGLFGAQESNRENMFGDIMQAFLNKRKQRPSPTGLEGLNPTMIPIDIPTGPKPRLRDVISIPSSFGLRG